MSDKVQLVLKLVNSTNEMISLCNEQVSTLNKLNIAVIKDKLLKDIKFKTIQPKELSNNTKELLEFNRIPLSRPFIGCDCRIYDNGIVEIRTSIKNNETYVYVIDNKVILCPVQ